MLIRFARLIVFIAAVQILGGHWLALQSVAWIGMLADYSRGEPLGEAIEKTFNGEHPCGLCEVVKNGRQKEHKQQLAKTVVKLDAVLGSIVEVPAPWMDDWQHHVKVRDIGVRTLAPPTPPPRKA